MKKHSEFFIRNSKFEILLITAAALFTNFLYFASTLPDYLFPDSLTYLVPARNMLRGLGFVDVVGAAETMRTPGYPLLLAAFGARVTPVIVAQHLMNVAIAAGIYLLVAPRLGRFVAVTAALLFAIDTPAIHYANKILSETFFTLVLLIVCWQLAVGRWRAAG